MILTSVDNIIRSYNDSLYKQVKKCVELDTRIKIYDIIRLPNIDITRIIFEQMKEKVQITDRIGTQFRRPIAERIYPKCGIIE